MIRLLFFFLLVLALGGLFAWVADKPGAITLTWLGTQYETSLMVALTALVILIALILFVWGIVKSVVNTPHAISSFFQNRRKDRGYQAISRGLIAASSGDVDSARALARESGKLLGKEPLVELLKAQTALLEGKREEACNSFQTMLGQDNTRLVALRGLFMEAERQGEAEAARQYATEANRLAPSLPWASTAKLKYLAMDGDWEGAVKALQSNQAAGLVDKEKAKRQRAVLLTALATSEEPTNPDDAAKHAREAHKLANDLVPSAVIYARAASRTGDIRGAAKVIETTWKHQPHPDLGEAYVHVRSGDSVVDRLKRAKKLASLRTNHPEGALLVAAAAIDAKDWELARKTLEPVLTTNPSERACLLMADIEEGQHGDQGAMQVWLSRAVRAPADPVWTADGHVSEEWLPISPVTGEIDAFEWKVPVEKMGFQPLVISAEDLVLEAVEQEAALKTAQTEETDHDVIVVEAAAEDAIEAVVEHEALPSDEAKNESEQMAAEGEEVEETDAVEFPLKRRPDDPGVDPNKEAPKKGFSLF